jgi:hypothetical protein
VFGSDGFTCINPNTDLLIDPTYSYKYSEVAAVVMRARPEHADVRHIFPSIVCEALLF